MLLNLGLEVTVKVNYRKNHDIQPVASLQPSTMSSNQKIITNYVKVKHDLYDQQIKSKITESPENPKERSSDLLGIEGKQTSDNPFNSKYFQLHNYFASR